MSESTRSIFRDNPLIYDALVDWPRRLKNEEPFYRRLVQQVGVRTLLDTACGSGQHANMFHSWGLSVEGADVSPGMIAHCRDTFGESDTLRWVERSFDQRPDPPGKFDAVVCVGNSLALAPDHQTVRRAVHAMLTALRPNGVCVIQVLNLWRLSEGPTLWQKCKRLTIDGTDSILLKCIHRVGSRGFVDFAHLRLDGDAVESRTETSVILGFEADELTAAARESGAESIGLIGSYANDPYNRAGSNDLILTCRKA